MPAASSSACSIISCLHRHLMPAASPHACIISCLQHHLLPGAASPDYSIISSPQHLLYNMSCLQHHLLLAASPACSISCLQHLLASITYACLLPRGFSQVPSQSSFLGKLVHLKGEMRPVETFSFFYYSSDQFQRGGLGGNLVEFIILLYQQTATQTVSS